LHLPPKIYPTAILINNLKTKFGEEAMAMQIHGIPGTPWLKIVCPNYVNEMPIANQS
jgi:hypothetical protein